MEIAQPKIEGDQRGVKYVFLDVVGFSSRTPDEQVRIVRAMNKIVAGTLNTFLPGVLHILIPTGDGLCIAVLADEPIDIHLKIALNVLEKLDAHNKHEAPASQESFQLRIDLNEGMDSLITDIKGSVNVIGEHINMSQRIMSASEPNGILVGVNVFSSLKEIEAHRGRFVHSPFTEPKYQKTIEAYRYSIGGGEKSQSSPIPISDGGTYIMQAPSFSDAYNNPVSISINASTRLKFDIESIRPGQSYVFYFHFRTTRGEKGWIGICRAPHERFWTNAERTELESNEIGPGTELKVLDLITQRWPELNGTPLTIDRLRFRGDDSNPGVVRASVTFTR